MTSRTDGRYSPYAQERSFLEALPAGDEVDRLSGGHGGVVPTGRAAPAAAGAGVAHGPARAPRAGLEEVAGAHRAVRRRTAGIRAQASGSDQHALGGAHLLLEPVHRQQQRLRREFPRGRFTRSLAQVRERGPRGHLRVRPLRAQGRPARRERHRGTVRPHGRRLCVESGAASGGPAERRARRAALGRPVASVRAAAQGAVRHAGCALLHGRARGRGRARPGCSRRRS